MSDGFSGTHGYYERKRAQIRETARIIGIDEPYLSRLVDAFYGRIRADVRLGPIFEAELGEDWEPHLHRMKRFWASIALNAGSYSGKPVAVHQGLQGIEREDFHHWLALFRRTLEDTASTSDAVSYLKIRAERVAQSLKIAMFDKTEDGVPTLR